MIQFGVDQVNQVGGSNLVQCQAGQLQVRLLSHFSLDAGGGQRTDRWGNHPVREAVVQLGSARQAANIYGTAQFRLDVSTLPNGPVGLSMVAREGERRPMFSPAAGPDLQRNVAYSSQPSRMYRPVYATVTLANGYFDPLGQHQIVRGSRYAAIYRVEPCLIEIDWRPDFIQSPNQGVRSRGIDLVVIHQTANPDGDLRIGPTLSHFGGDAPDSAQNKGGISIHYIVDVDGFVVKMMPDEAKAFHAGEGGESFWRGQNGVADNAVGIEIVHVNGDSAFTEAQYQSLIRLLHELVSAHQATGLTNERIVFHSDIRMDGTGSYINGNKKGCPGLGFRWQRLLDAGFGPSPQWTSAHMYAVQGIYNGFFDTPGAKLVRNDNDQEPKYNGATSGYAGAGLVAKLQRRLAHIGYSISESFNPTLTGENVVNGQVVDGVYSRAVASSVDSFRIHHMGRGTADFQNTPFDHETALTLEAVYQAT